MSKVTEEFSDENIPQSNWFKFDEVGANIKWTYVDRITKEGSWNLPAQFIYVLAKAVVNWEETGDTYNVWIKQINDYVLSRLKKIKLGQRIGFKFTELIPPKVKGNNPAKSITPYVWDMDKDYESMPKPEATTTKSSASEEINIEDIPFS